MDNDEQATNSRHMNLSNDLPEYQSIPPYLESTFDLLLCAFPNMVSEEEYWAILTILSETMSQRPIAHVVSILTKKNWALVFNDVAGVGIEPPSSNEVMYLVMERLKACGYDEWLSDS